MRSCRLFPLLLTIIFALAAPATTLASAPHRTRAKVHHRHTRRAPRRARSSSLKTPPRHTTTTHAPAPQPTQPASGSTTTTTPAGTTTTPTGTTTGGATTTGGLTAPSVPAVPAVPAITGTTYYVSPNGNDSNSGTSPDQAWKTVDQVNRTQLQPGDGVLFQGGATYSDDILMPGWGTGVAGTSSAPIVIESYGTGQASFPQGIWIKGESYIVFDNLNIGPDAGISGNGDNNITVQNCTIHDIMPATEPNADTQFAINALGDNWTIVDNTINNIGNSGMLLQGSNDLIEGNTISNTGLNPAVSWGAHGIYDKVIDATIADNTITNFQNEGISVRYEGSTIVGNTISGGQYGIGFHEYDTNTGTSQWFDNTISNTSIVGIYISPHDIGGYTHENFVISGNQITAPAPQGNWIQFDIQTSGTVTGLPAGVSTGIRATS